MEANNRRSETPSERAEREAIERTLKVSTYLTDDFWESIHQGRKPVIQMPASELASETEGEHMSFDSLMKNASLNPDSQYSTPAPNRQESNKPKFVLSKNQAEAIRKYPQLVDFLGRDESEVMAKVLMGEVILAIAKTVGDNSKECNPHAIMCQADKHNLKQYFKGEDWLCRVTASGPFRGDEAIYYSKERDQARVLRKTSTAPIHYDDVTDDFNVIYESASSQELTDYTENQNIEKTGNPDTE